MGPIAVATGHNTADPPPEWLRSRTFGPVTGDHTLPQCDSRLDLGALIDLMDECRCTRCTPCSFAASRARVPASALTVF